MFLENWTFLEKHFLLHLVLKYPLQPWLSSSFLAINYRILLMWVDSDIILASGVYAITVIMNILVICNISSLVSVHFTWESKKRPTDHFTNSVGSFVVYRSIKDGHSSVQMNRGNYRAFNMGTFSPILSVWHSTVSRVQKFRCISE